VHVRLRGTQEITAKVLGRLGDDNCHSGRRLFFEAFTNFAVHPDSLEVDEFYGFPTGEVELGVAIVYVPGLEPLLEAEPELMHVIEIEPQTLWVERPYMYQREVHPAILAVLRGEADDD
jgi:hypothetical protein